METQLWAIAVKGDQSVSEIKKVCEELAEVSPFNVPASALRVGTLDNLMSLSDDLTKMETMADATVTKMYKQLMDLKDRVGIKDDEATIGGGECTADGGTLGPLRHLLARLCGVGGGGGGRLTGSRPSLAADCVARPRCLTRPCVVSGAPSQCRSPHTPRGSGSGTRPS